MSIPSYDVDFYSDEFIADPWPHYEKMRQLGPVVWLPQHQNYALVHHKHVQQALRKHAVFCSAKGVAGDKFGCDFLQGNTVASDEPRHSQLRKAMAPPLLPGALDAIRQRVQRESDALITDLLKKRSFDAIADLARHLPLTIVRQLVGLPDSGQDKMLRWAAAAFDVLGMQNERGKAGVVAIREMREFLAAQKNRAALKEESWTWRIQKQVDGGTLPDELAQLAMRDYINPSLDTTISATGQLIWQLGKNPDQWKLLKEHPDLISNAVNEAVRLGTPIRSFSRHTTRDVDIDGVTIPAGSRVMMVYASANRDESVFNNPEVFDVTRDPYLHVGFGSGIHMCVGMHLAQLEMESLLRSMIPRVGTITTGAFSYVKNNTIHALADLSCTFEAEQKTIRQPESSVKATDPIQTLEGTITRREVVAKDIVSLEISPGSDQTFPAVTAGAHLDVYIAAGLVRQYSITEQPDSGIYRIAVQREQYSKGGSKALYENYPLGSAIEIGKPRNNFPLREGSGPVLLLAGGIGITPLLAMAWELHKTGRPFTLHVSARSKNRIAFLSRLPVLPFAGSLQINTDDGSVTGQSASSLIAMATDDTDVYVCGPTGYMAFITDQISTSEINPERVYQEHFGAELNKCGDRFTVIAKKSGISFMVESGQTILDGLCANAISVKTSCENGVCGSCLTPVLSGKPDHRDMVQTDIEKASNTTIAVCCSRSLSKILELDI